MMRREEYSEMLERLFNPTDQSLKLDIATLADLCGSPDHKKLIDVSSILCKLFLTGRSHLSLRELLSHSVLASPSKQPSDRTVDFFVDALQPAELIQIIRELHKMRKKLKNTVYSLRLGQVIEMLRKTVEEGRVGERRGEELGNIVVGDFELVEEEVRKFQSANTLAFTNPSSSKISDFLNNPRAALQGRFSNPQTLLKLLSTEIMPALERSLFCIPLTHHTQREGELSRILKFIHGLYIPPYQIEIEISKNTLVETRIYLNRIARELLLLNHRAVIRSLARVLNEAVLCPSSMHIQILLLRVLRRLYFLGENAGTHSSEHVEARREGGERGEVGEVVRNPLFLVLRNIALFAEGREEELKQAAMLCYKVVQDKNDLQFATMLENSEDLRFLRNSKYYSSKAYAYADEIEKIYEPIELGGLHWKNHHFLAAREVWSYNVLVEKPSSLLCWEFHLAGYDIRFGVYKVEQLRDFTLEDYEKGVDCKQAVKMEKVTNLAANPHRGHLYLKNGMYRLVFDNSYSMMRGKDLLYCFLHLESSS